jgi:hypothetical protein
VACGDGWFAKMPRTGGGDPGSLKARQISLPSTYSPSDQLVSRSADSELSMRGGST